MGTEEIIEKTQDYFCFGLEKPDLEAHIEYVRTLAPGEIYLDWGTGQGRYAITAAMANPKIRVVTFDCGRRDMTNEFFAERMKKRCAEQKVKNVEFSFGHSLEIFPDWDKEIAFINIDASGQYEDTKGELERWTPFLKRGGRIYMQSYFLKDKYPGISKAVDELVAKDPLYTLGDRINNSLFVYKDRKSVEVLEHVRDGGYFDKDMAPSILDELNKLPNKGSLLEIGSGFGDSARFFAKAKPNWIIYSVDVYGTLSEYKYGAQMRDFKEMVEKTRFEYPNILWMVHDSFTMPWELMVDVLYIDGDHRYDAVKKDFERYSPFVKPGGFILFDDYGRDTELIQVQNFIDNEIDKRMWAVSVYNHFALLKHV